MDTNTRRKKAKISETAQSVSKAPAFSKEKILTFQRYAKRRDLLSVLLKNGQEYTHEQILSVIDDFMKGKVK